MSLLLAPYTVLDVPLNWLLDPVMVLDESFLVVLVLVFCWLAIMVLNLDLSANKASIEACLSLSPPISNAKGDPVLDDDDTVLEEDMVVVIFCGCASDVMSLCSVVSGAMAPLTSMVSINRIRMSGMVIDFECMGLF